MPPILMIAIEAVPIAEVRRLASKFFDCRCQKSAGILYVFQGFLAKAGGKFAVKMRAAAIGTASYIGKLIKYQIHIKNKTAYLKNMRFSAIIKHRNKREVFLWVYEFCDIFLEPV